MILLDTNVLSAVMQRRPERTVLASFDGQPASTLWTTSVTMFEAFDAEAAWVTGRLADGRRSEVRDPQIAEIASSNRAVVATHNVPRFDQVCEAVYPWEAD